MYSGFRNNIALFLFALKYWIVTHIGFYKREICILICIYRIAIFCLLGRCISGRGGRCEWK